MKTKRLLISVLSLFSVLAIAYEVDNFTDRYKPLPDSRDALNDEVNRLMKLARLSVSKKKGCSPDIVQATRKHLGGWMIGSLEEYADESETIERHKASTKKSIYSRRSVGDKAGGFVLTFAGLNSSINLNGQYVGADKLGHFFDQGGDYFDVYKEEDDPSKGVQKALRLGTKLEEGMFGLRTTGVKSYGDLAANYAGFQFWMNLIDGSDPYFKCQNNKWVQVRKFDFKDYVNPAWDEAINCSEFKNKSLAETVEAQEEFYEEQAQKNNKNRRFVCPVSPNECVKMKKIYGDNAARLLSEKCLNAKDNAEPLRSSAQVSSEELGTSRYQIRVSGGNNENQDSHKHVEGVR